MKTLYVLQGPTAVGKTELSLLIAEHLGCPIISADSRQMYRDIPIGTAAPTAEEQQRVRHYFVGNLPLDASYNAAQYESEALALAEYSSADRLSSLALLISESSMRGG